MSVNPYAPPTAVVADLAPPSDVGTEPPFFAVSVTKLVVMSICTFSIYEVYWFYRHWKQIAEREREAISPLARAIFTIIFCYSCFARMRDYEAETGTSTGAGRLAAVPLAIAWVVTTLLWRLPDPYWWISMLAVLFLVPVQMHANRLNTAVAPLHHRNARFSAANWIGVIVGGLFLMLALAGTFLPPPDVIE
jgi:hypothetical protein